MAKISNKYYNTLKLNPQIEEELSMSKSRFEYFVTLLVYIETTRENEGEDYRCGYDDVKKRYIEIADNAQDDLDRLYALVRLDLRKINDSDKDQVIEGKSYQYRLGEIDALNDINYCKRESKKHTHEFYHMVLIHRVDTETITVPSFYRLQEDRRLKKNLSKSASMYDFFTTLLDYLELKQAYYHDKYAALSTGYVETISRYKEYAANEKNNLDKLKPMIINELKEISNQNKVIKKGAVTIHESKFNIGKQYALMDVAYCVQEAKKFFMESVNKQLKRNIFGNK